MEVQSKIVMGDAKDKIGREEVFQPTSNKQAQKTRNHQ